MITQITETVKGYLAHPYAPYVLIAVALIGGLIVACHGKKLLNLLKFLVCAGAGLVAGYMLATLPKVAAILAPVLAPVSSAVAPYLASVPFELDATALVVGAVLAVVAALLCKVLYPLALAGALGYGAYYALTLPTVAALLVEKLPQAAALYADPTYLIVAAVVVGVLALILRGLIEMLGTAAAGGYAFAWGVEKLVLLVLALSAGKVYESIFQPITVVIVAGLIALIGLVKQIKNRHRF